MTHDEKLEIRATVKKGVWGIFATLIATSFILGTMLQDIKGQIKQNASKHDEYQHATNHRLDKAEQDIKDIFKRWRE